MAGDQGVGGGLSGVVAIIAAVGRNGAIGQAGGLPWRLSSDLRRFKALTMGKPLVMGRKTFESLRRPLPGRRLIVVTRDPAFAHPGVEVAHGLEEAIALGAEAEEIMIGGGEEIYAQALSFADRLYLTEVDLAPAADARFPAIDRSRWRETRREPGRRGPNDEADFAFVKYERV